MAPVKHRLQRPVTRHCRAAAASEARNRSSSPAASSVARDSADLASELVTSSGYRADQPALRSERSTHCDDLGLQIVLLDYPPRQLRAIIASLLTMAPCASMSAISTSNARPPSLIGWPSATARRDDLDLEEDLRPNQFRDHKQHE